MVEQWRILVVESEENLNWNIVNTLQKDGYFVRGVTSGAEAIRLLWSEECDVAICNSQMPDADGFDLLQWMRTYCPSTRMVMLAIPGTSVTRTQALEMGVASYLEKPLDMRALKEELRRLLHQTGFSASLDSFDLLDVIQIITMSRKSIALVVSIGLEEEGVLRFQNGELVWAEYGVLRGEEAFFALAAHKNGTVVHRPWNEQTTPNVTQPLSRLIFQALQYRSKYSDYQQMSSEQEAVRPGQNTGVSPLLSALPPTTIPDALESLDDDDRPFQFVAEERVDTLAENTPPRSGFGQFMPGASSSPLEQMGGVMGVRKNMEPDIISATDEKEWWLPTGTFPSTRSGNIQAITDQKLKQGQPGGSGMHMTPVTPPQPPVGQNNGLPSWLTDQPTHLDLPVLRGNTGQMPSMPKEQSASLPAVRQQYTGQIPVQPRDAFSATPSLSVPPASSLPPAPPVSSVPLVSPMSPVLPATPGQPQPANAIWPETQPSRPVFLDPSDAGLRKTKPDDALFTGTQRTVKPGQTGPRPTPAEWQGPRAIASGQTGQMSPVKPTRMGESKGEPLQSLAALKRPTSPSVPAPEVRMAGSETRPAPITPVRPLEAGSIPPTNSPTGILPKPTTEKTTRRNYPALAAALQTLGYSVPGFVASAVVGLDGTPIAQVTIDELDIAPLCLYFSSVMQNVLKAMEQGHWEDHESTIIASRTRYILLRIVGTKKDIFQVLITTREADTSESLEVMANIEAAITTAL